MASPKITNKHLVELAQTYWHWKKLWLATTAVFGVVALTYVLFLKGDTWVASQGLIVRDEANGAVMRLGRFESQTAMKAAQETIMEMARNSQVLGDALDKVGSEEKWLGFFAKPTKQPSNAQIEALAERKVSIRAPRGAEFGTTEVIYLDVKQSSKTRALELNEAVCDALENRLKQVRQARANGVISELLAARQAACTNLERATKKLQVMEAEAGADLSDLRGLTDTLSGGSTTRVTMDAVKKEMLTVEIEVGQLEVDLNTAKASFDDPSQLLLTPTKLVNTQPGLKKLREGLSAAAIASSQLQGRFTANHPRVVASRATEERIREQVRAELGNSVETLTKALSFAHQRLEKLKNQYSSLESRISRLAEIRAGYSNVASEVRARNQQLQDAERELAQAEAARDAALTSSLLTRIDKPIIGENPTGPGRSTILAGATVSGLFFGFGIVFLLTPLDAGINYGRRQLDYSGNASRRNADRTSAAPLQADLTKATQPASAARPVPVVNTEAPAGQAKTITQAIREQSANQVNPGPAPEAQLAPNGFSSAAEASPQASTSFADSAAQSPGTNAQLPGTNAQLPGTNATHSQTPQSTGSAAEVESIEAAQAVIKAALGGGNSFSTEADSAPKG